MQIGARTPRKDPFIRLVYSGLFLIYHKIIVGKTVTDPSCPYVFGTKRNYLSLLPYLSFMREGFWWGFVAAVKLNKIDIYEHEIIHAPRIDGSTQVYKINKMPGIIFRNMKGLLQLYKYTKNNKISQCL